MEVFEPRKSDQIDVVRTKLSPNSIEERIKANLEPLHAQIGTLTQIMNKLIQDISARLNPTADSRDRKFPSGSPLTDGPGTSKTLPFESLVNAVYSPDKGALVMMMILLLPNWRTETN